MKDIAPELLLKLQEEFNKKFNASRKIKELNKKLLEGNVTHQESNELAIELGTLLSDIYMENIKSERLPEGKLFYNIARRTIEPTIKQNYDLISNYSRDVQTTLNKKAGLKILGIPPDINQDRIDGIINRVSSEKFEEVRWILDEPIKNFSQSIVDDTVKTNADFQYKLGLKPKIVRKEAGSCCDWCREVVGIYEYPKVPKDVYRRHRYCRCTVEYHPGDGKVQNVHTKRFLTENEIKEREKRKSVSSDIKYLNRKYDTEQYRRYASVLGYENMPKSLPLFQEIKYNDIIDYEKLKSRYHVKNNIKRGVWGKKINKEKQAPHNESTREIGKSYLFKNIDSQELFDRYAGRGILQKTLAGKYSNKEICSADVEIGIDFRTGKETKMFKIHHSKNRTHIVPYIEKE